MTGTVPGVEDCFLVLSRHERSGQALVFRASTTERIRTLIYWGTRNPSTLWGRINRSTEGFDVPDRKLSKMLLYHFPVEHAARWSAD